MTCSGRNDKARKRKLHLQQINIYQNPLITIVHTLQRPIGSLISLKTIEQCIHSRTRHFTNKTCSRIEFN